MLNSYRSIRVHGIKALYNKVFPFNRYVIWWQNKNIKRVLYKSLCLALIKYKRAYVYTTATSDINSCQFLKYHMCYQPDILRMGGNSVTVKQKKLVW